MLASDEITITIDNETVHLRPTLRAAMRLERKHGGFQNIAKSIAEQNLMVMASIIVECSPNRRDILATLNATPLRNVVGLLVEPLMSLVFELAGFAEDDVKAPAEPMEAQRITFAEHHARLFKLATGWLLWTPETAWNATPKEILAAYEGRVDYLKAIYGASDDAKTKELKELDSDTQWRLALAKFPTVVVKPDDGGPHA